MALPKRRHSVSRRNNRRSQQRLTPPTLNPCPQCQTLRTPHAVCPTCGSYRGRTVVDMTPDDSKTEPTKKT